jgi:hypothetical protein
MPQVALAENKGMDMIEMAVSELSKQVTNEAIAELSKKYMPLKINGLEDKKGYEAVHAARMDVVKRRTAVEKKRKELKADALKFGQAVDAEAKRITALLHPIENHLESEESAIVQEKARIAAEKERLEQERIQGRVNRLYEMGCRFDGQKFSLPFAPDGFFLPHTLAKTAADEQFEVFCAEFQKLIDAENARIAEVERLRKEEEARLAKIREEQEAEAKRLAEIARKQEEEAARIRAEAEAERKRLDDERKAAEDKIREEREAIEKEKRAIEEAKEKEEAEAKRKQELENARKEAAEKAQREAEEKAKREAEEKAAQEKSEAEEAARQEALRPDKEKLLKLADALDSFELPVLKHKKPIAILTDVKRELTNMALFIREEVGQLKPRKTK